MVNEKVLVRDKYRGAKLFLKVFLIMFLVVAVIVIIFVAGFTMRNPKNEIVLENPLKGIVFANTNEAGEVDYDKVVEEGILDFNEEYILYLLVAMGVQKLHKSYIGYGAPVLEMNIDGEVWNARVSNGVEVNQGSVEEEDLIIYISKEEAINALLSSDIKGFMKESVINGGTRLEGVAGEVELGSKGYLEMYNFINR